MQSQSGEERLIAHPVAGDPIDGTKASATHRSRRWRHERSTGTCDGYYNHRTHAIARKETEAMLYPSRELIAAVRAVRGESDLDAIMPAFGDMLLAHVLALAPGAHGLVRAVAALCGGLPSLLDAPTIANPAMHDAVARLIGTRAGRTALRTWAEVAPAGWGRAHADALITAVHANMCGAGDAAALLGPCTASVALLAENGTPAEIAFAIRRWGESSCSGSSADDPTAWMVQISDEERDRALSLVQRAPSSVADCLPWLPPEAAGTAWMADDLPVWTLDSFTDAPPIARVRHRATIRNLVAHAQPEHLGVLTRLACRLRTKDIRRRICTLLHDHPDAALDVVCAAPWNALANDVRAAILNRAADSDMCAAIAAARGRRDAATQPITEETAAAFFAALDPAVWDALDADTQRQWLQEMPDVAGHLAVRSLGLRPEVLARARIGNDFVRAALRHARTSTRLRQALVPVALRAVGVADASMLITETATIPHDPSAFFCCASGHDSPRTAALASTRLATTADLAAAIVFQRVANGDAWVYEACVALTEALRGRTWDGAAALLAFLDDCDRAAFPWTIDALVDRLAHPDRREALRHALTRLESLPPDIAIPSLFALERCVPGDVVSCRDSAAGFAHALRTHGDIFLDVVDAIADPDMRDALLPSFNSIALTHAVRSLARDDPWAAQHVAHAVNGRLVDTVIQTLRTTTSPRAVSVLDAIIASDHPFAHDLAASLSSLAADGCADALNAAWRRMVALHPREALALATLTADTPDDRVDGIRMLATHPDSLHLIWDYVSPQVRESFRMDVVAHHAITNRPASASGERRRR